MRLTSESVRFDLEWPITKYKNQSQFILYLIFFLQVRMMYHELPELVHKFKFQTVYDLVRRLLAREERED